MGSEFIEILTSAGTIFPLLLTFKIAGATLLLHGSIGIALAYLLSKSKPPFKAFFEGVVNIPLIFPPIATGLFLLLLLGRNGIIGKFFLRFEINLIFSFPGLIIASFIAGLPLLVKPVQTAIETFNPSLIYASYSLGKSGLVTFIRVVLPCIRRTIFSGLLLSFGRSLGEVGITMMIGGNIRGRTDTLSLAIYNAVMDGEYKKALFLSAILCVISLVILILLNIKRKDN